MVTSSLSMLVSRCLATRDDPALGVKLCLAHRQVMVYIVATKSVSIGGLRLKSTSSSLIRVEMTQLTIHVFTLGLYVFVSHARVPGLRFMG